MSNFLLIHKVKNLLIKVLGNIKQRKFKCTDFTIISNNCFAGIVYRNNSLIYRSPTCGVFIMPTDFIKFIYDIKKYLDYELIQINCNESKYCSYLEKISYDGIIGKLGDIEIMFLHYKNFEDAKKKWIRRKERINYDKIIYKFNDQNNCTINELKQFNNFEAENKICFTAKRYDEIESYVFTEFEDDGYVKNDAKESVFKKYFDIYEYINERFDKNI